MGDVNSVWMPTLSYKGWVTNLAEVIDTALAHMFVSDYSQSNLHFGSITSFSWLVANYGTVPSTMANETEVALEKYLSKYADKVEVNVTYNYPDNSTSGSEYNLFINLQVWKDGQQYGLSEQLEIIESKFKRIVEAING